MPTKSEYVVASARLPGIGSIANDFSQWLSILSRTFPTPPCPPRLTALHGARRPLVSIPGTSVTSATPVTCRASLALSSRRAFKGPRGALKSDPAKKNVAGSVVVRTSHTRRWCVLRRRDPAVALSRSCHLDTPPRSIPRGARGLAASCVASRPVPAATARSGNRGFISPRSLFSRQKRQVVANRRLPATDPPSPRDVPNVSQTRHADETRGESRESRRRVSAGFARRREPPRRASRGRRGARKRIRESDRVWLIYTRVHARRVRCRVG